MLTYKKISEDISELHNIGIDFFEGKFKLSNLTYSLFITTFESHYNKQGIDWIEWFIFEGNWGTTNFNKMDEPETESTIPLKWGVFDNKGNPIVYSYKTLWELLEADYKI